MHARSGGGGGALSNLHGPSRGSLEFRFINRAPEPWYDRDTGRL